jgi:hypothetical protein
VILQPASQHAWGTLLPPGRYRTMVSRDAWQTCFVIPPDPNQPILVFDQSTGAAQRTPH